MKEIKNTGFLLIAISVFVLSGCSILNQAKSFDRFVKSKFQIQSIAFQKVGDVDVSNGKKLNFQEVIAVTQKFFQKNLSAQVLLTVYVQNPFHQKAAVSGMDWIMEKDGNVISHGQVSKQVIVPGDQETSFPVEAVFNASEVLQSQNIQQVISFITRADGERKFSAMGLTFKVKPWYKLVGKIHKFPGYINIKPVF